MPQPLNTIPVSVVIPTYKRSDYLIRALRSVLAQTHKNVEIIVVDDSGAGSDDQLATEQALSSSAEFGDVLYVAQPHNAGGCAARNAGFRLASGKYVAFLDDDDEWHRDFVIRHLEVFRDTRAALVYCNYFSSNGKTSKKIQMTNYRGEVHQHLIRGWCPSSTSLFMLDKEMLGKPSQLFDESLVSFQDYDCWMTLSLQHDFDYCDEYLVVKYDHDQEQISRNPVKRRRGIQQLSSKWCVRLEGSDLDVFRHTLTKFEKHQLWNEFHFANRSQSIKQAVRAALNYVRFGKTGVMDYARIAKHLLKVK